MIFVKFVVLILLGFVVVSLFSGLYFLVKDKGQTNRTVNALSLRIGLSLVAILVVLIAGYTGVIEFNPSPLSRTGQQQAREANKIDAPQDESKPGSGRRPINSSGS